jgi:alanine-glyoxylate transaminase/serine-glyoxylate transaminase/serine-pyruvate transaminase
MEAYEARKPAYFGTPAVNLVWALNVSLGQILAEGMSARVARHRRLSSAFKAGMAALGLQQVPVRAELQADTLSGLYYPDGTGAELLGLINEGGVIVAGGLHPAIKARYFRVGHMGAVTEADIVATVSAIERALCRTGATIEPGAGVAAATILLRS